MQLVLLCVLVLSLLQPGLLQDGGTEDTPTNGGGRDLSQSITELKSIALAQTKLMVEVSGQLAIINATVSTLQERLESLTGEVGKNRQRIKSVNMRVKTVESGQAVSQNTSLELVTTTDQLSTGFNQLRRELTVNQQSSELAHNRTQEQLENFSREVRGQLATINDTVNTQCQQSSMEAMQGHLAVHTRQLVGITDQLDQLRTELTDNQQMITERVDSVSSGQVKNLNKSINQLQTVHTTIDMQLANATDQLSAGLNQLRRELTANQQNSELAHNRTQEQLEELSLSLQQQCRQSSLEALQDSLAAHTRQLATATDQLSTGHQALEDGLTEQLQTLTSDCDNTTAELLQGQETVLKTLYGIGENMGYLYTCGGSPGWRRVAFLNMTDSSQDCPSGWNLTTHSVRTCGRASSGRRTCDPVTFPVRGGEYGRVCGRIRGYRYGAAWALRGAYEGRPLDDYYVDGISITHGLPRQHIWTFAVGLAQERCCHYSLYQYCYCDVQTHPNGYQAIPPSFVGNDYFCEAGESGQRYEYRLYSENPLWDGEGCGQSSTCCSMNNPPYFMKDLPAPTTDDIEVRLCADYYRQSEYPVELLEIYVQ